MSDRAEGAAPPTARFDAFAVPGDGGSEAIRRTTRLDALELAFPDVGPDDVGAVAKALRATRPALLGLRAYEIATALGRVGARFLDAADPLRLEALSLLPVASGLSAPMAELVLDGMARDWTADRLHRLLEVEFDDPAALDGFVTVRGRRAHALGGDLCVQVVAGSVPGVGVMALLRALLVKSPTLIKPGLGDVVLPVLFARALREDSPRLAESVAVLYWPGGSHDLERAALGEADVVVGYGSDATVKALRESAPLTARFVPYHHRVSAGAVGSEALTAGAAPATAMNVARAAAVFDQRGCVSPQVVFVEESGEVGVAAFARLLADAFAELEGTLPSGVPDAEEAAALQQLRGTAEMLAGDPGRGLYHGGAGASWTVILDAGTEPVEACVGRVVRVRPLSDSASLPDVLRPYGGHLQTLGLAGFGDRLEDVARACGEVGVSRVTGFRVLPFPPAWWYHDGRGPLAELVRWVEVDP